MANSWKILVGAGVGAGIGAGIGEYIAIKNTPPLGVTSPLGLILGALSGGLGGGIIIYLILKS